MRYINTTNDNITFTDVDGRVVIVPKNKVYTHFKNDTITFLLVERYDKEGICLFTTLAEDLQINGVTYTYEQLLNGEGIDNMFSPTGLIIKLVDELPASGEQNTIYLVANDKGSFTEYLWLEETSKWEELGDVTKIDLSNYFTKSEINAMFANYYTQSEIDDIFDGYYTKTEVDDKLDLKANVSEVYTKTEADNKFLTEHQSLDNYYTKDEVYDKTESDEKYATQTVVDELDIKLNAEQARAEAKEYEIEQTLFSKADISDTYTKWEVDDALSEKQDTSTAFSGDYYDLTNKPDLTVYAESADLATVAFSGSYNDLSDKPTIPTVPTNVSAFTNDAGYLTQNDLSDYVDKETFDTKEEVISTALNELHDSIPNMDKYYTKSEVDAELADKQDKLTAGANITIDANNVISSTGGEQQQSDWNQADSTAVDYIKNKPAIPDMTNYYTKTEIDNKFSEIETLLSQI